MRVWPGHPYPLGATWDGAGVNFALFSEHATKVELCLFDSAGRHAGVAPHPADGIHRPGLARLPARRAARPALRLSRPRALRAGQGAPLQPQQGRARPLRQGDRPRPAAGTTRCSATRSATRRPTSSFDDRDSAAVRPAGGGGRPGLHLGRRPAAAHALAQDAHLRAARQGLHPAQPGRAREAARHLRRPGLRVGHQAPDRPGRHGRRAAAGPPPPRRPPPDREGAAATTGATTRWASSPRRRATAAPASRRTPCSSSR